MPRNSTFRHSFALVAALSTTLTPPNARAQDFVVAEATINELLNAMETGQVTAVQLVDAFLARIAAYDRRGPQLNAMIRLNPNARAEAAELDRERSFNGPRGPLHGIPIILKDNYDTFDMPTAAASIALARLVPPDDGFQVRKLREAGAIIIGKANMHELAMGITTISSLGGQTLNPYDLTRYPGGSSGGTGAAIAASFAAVGWGSDTCGSIRIPSSQNNLFGLRSTKGLSSIDGIIPLSHTQDVGGPMARTATDLAIVLDATIGPDPADPATNILAGRELPRFVQSLDANALRGARLGVLTAAFGGAPEDREMARVVRDAIDEMEDAGATIVDSLEIPSLDSLTRRAAVINFEFKFDFIDYLAATPGAPVSSIREILDGGLHHTALANAFRRRDSVAVRNGDDYQAAIAGRADVRNALVAALEEHELDALIYPTMRRKAARIGDPQRGSNCRFSATSGLPALTVPAGFTNDGLPVGLELLGTTLSDARLLSLGFAFERATGHRRPPSTTPPLENGRAPERVSFDVRATGAGASALAQFALDITTNTLEYELVVSGVAANDIYAVNIHLADEGNDGSVVRRLAPPGSATGAGRFSLTVPEREALLDSRLYLVVYTREHPTGAARVRLVMPAR